MNKKVLIFLFVFINYFNPISIYVTLLFDLFLAAYLLSNCTLKEIKEIKLNKIILYIAIVIFLWMMLILTLRGNFNTYVFGKYFRISVASVLIMTIVTRLKITAKDLIPIMSVIFIMHIAFVGLQNYFPQLDIPMAKIFGFERETDVISDMSIRKMGLSSSYDTAALIALASMSFFFMMYKSKLELKYLIMSSLSLLATIRISRTGMVIGILIFTCFLINLFFTLKGRKKLVPTVFFIFGLIMSVYIILPIMAASTVSFLVDSKFSGMDVSNNDYSTGSTSVLTDSQSEALKMPLSDLIFGVGIDPNRIVGKGTDIGYIKIIYHIGIIGLCAVMFLYFYFLKKSYTIKKNTIKNSDEYILSAFLILYVLIMFLMNYKSLEIYSRGAHDILLILFLGLVLGEGFKAKAVKRVEMLGVNKNLI